MNRVEPARAFGAEHGYRQLDDVRIGEGPQRLKVGDDAETTETRNVFGAEQLEVSDVVARIAAAVAGAGELERVERVAYGAVADGVDVDLKACAVERGDQRLEDFRLDVGLAAVAAGAEVRLKQRGGARFDDAVGKDFRGGGAQPAALIRLAQLDQARDLRDAL